MGTIYLNAVDFNYSREIHAVFDNMGSLPVFVILVANTIYDIIYMDTNLVKVPAGKSLEISFLNLGDGKVRVITQLQS